MRLKLPADQVRALHSALRNAGTREIGGQIFGEQLAPSDFLASEITFQKRPGTFARFVVDVIQAARDAVRFFERTDFQYKRYNYIGEWHSHPSFSVLPSSIDFATMQGLVSDPEFKGSFAILMITRLDEGNLYCRAWVFDPAGVAAEIVLEKLQ